MIEYNKIYISTLSFVRSKTKELKQFNTFYNTLEDSIKWMRITLEAEYYEVYERDSKDDDELNEFIEEYITEFDYDICVISGSRKVFNTSKDIMEYFNMNIKTIKNDKLYDFLLSLVQWDWLFMDYKGNIINNCIVEQDPINESTIINEIKFSEESCKSGKYKFLYEIN